jgi:uncharacterized membrane-anchored protein
MKTWLLRIILMLQLTGLIGLYSYHLHIEKTGKTYLIKCEPVDPRDLLNGDYISLRYEISTLPERFPELDYKNQDVLYHTSTLRSRMGSSRRRQSTT